MDQVETISVTDAVKILKDASGQQATSTDGSEVQKVDDPAAVLDAK